MTAVLNRAAVGASSMSGGKLFQSLTVFGKSCSGRSESKFSLGRIFAGEYVSLYGFAW